MAVMAYHIDFQSLGFDYLKMRLTGEDLIPSQVPLRDGLNDNAAELVGNFGIQEKACGAG